MRSRLLLALLWLAATAAATSVGLAATQTVGDVIRGAGPLGPAFDGGASRAPQTPAAPVRSTIPGPAATLVVECTGRVAVLEEVFPAPGWELVDEERGPDEDVDVLLRRDGERAAVEVYCNQGAPRAVHS